MVSAKYTESPMFDQTIDDEHYADEIRILTKNGYEFTERLITDPLGGVYTLGVLTRAGRVVKVYEGEVTPF